MAAEQEEEKHMEQGQAAQLEKALATIERLQHQLDSLRSAIPTLIQPLIVGHPKDRVQTARYVADSANRTIAQLKKLRETWTSEQTQTVLSQVRQSASENSDFAKMSNVPAWGWSDAH